MNRLLYEQAARTFSSAFGERHRVAAYAPGRVEILGNHTDYNEGFVLSAAIDYGTFFLAAHGEGAQSRLIAGDLMEEVAVDVRRPEPFTDVSWPNYVVGVLAGLSSRSRPEKNFSAAFLGNVPIGAGLSSSAALEMAAGLALSALYGIETGKLELARIGQAAEHKYAGVKCGLLDQISSLFGKHGHLVMTDFRSLNVETVPLGDDACFLMVNTHADHALVDGVYNLRRESCERASRFFASVLGHPVTALRDVSWNEWERHSEGMDVETARRSAHPIGENARVLKARELLSAGNLDDFGQLMFESHQSSRLYFENSCPELDFLVDTAGRLPGVFGARLSGGGFGGSVVALVHPRNVEAVSHAMATAYCKRFGHSCDVRALLPSDGALVIESDSE